MLHETLEYMKSCRGKGCTLPRHQHGVSGNQPESELPAPVVGRTIGVAGTGKRKHHRDPSGGML